MKKFKIVSLSLICLTVLSACGSSSKGNIEINNSSIVQSSNKNKNTVSSSVKEESGDFVSKASDAYFDGKVLKGNTYTIKITDHKVIQPGEKGNEYGDSPVIAFWYDTLVSPDYSDSKSIDATNAWISNFKAIQDNDPNKVNELRIAPLPDDQFTDSQIAEIKPGGTVLNAVAYTMLDNETPVKLVSETVMGDKLGETEFKIK